MSGRSRVTKRLHRVLTKISSLKADYRHVSIKRTSKVTKLPMNTARVICSSIRHLFLNRVPIQIGVSFVLLSTIGLLLRAALN